MHIDAGESMFLFFFLISKIEVHRRGSRLAIASSSLVFRMIPFAKRIARSNRIYDWVAWTGVSHNRLTL